MVRMGIDAILVLALVVVVAIAAVTSLPAIGTDESLRGEMLRRHMVASGVLVVGLPIVALWFLARGVGARAFSRLGRAGYWALLASGWVAIASVYFCMVPVASTAQMHELIVLHGYAGLAVCVAVVLLVLGLVRRRRAAD